ncbi:hypothetical protein PR003_g18867 [Phytophthora rubi]|uniref:Uncharacterized protein n=1 Tax=Phytophthora rubi TaxID=129364 RepID=A0A6A4ECV9_9STRA|nr:hypothetical protein PR002_g19205 [Phytophthora rubi]KAE9021792.1 hypothetical protein PR001_g13296 [Phytophthora rubi]KAE9315901.1 hypothetical protein PR003_g18867 [Phytophthora rubi]
MTSAAVGLLVGSMTMQLSPSLAISCGPSSENSTLNVTLQHQSHAQIMAVGIP